MTTDHSDSTPLVLRPGAGRFVPKPQGPKDPEVVISRNVLQPRRRDEKTLTSRHRQVAGNLPSWEPLPPDELFVHRGK